VSGGGEAANFVCWLKGNLHALEAATAPFIAFAAVRFEYTLSVSTLAGPIYAEKERLRFGSDWPTGPLEVLIKEDHTAPYQNARQKLD
jgi:hypothetical protein